MNHNIVSYFYLVVSCDVVYIVQIYHKSMENKFSNIENVVLERYSEIADTWNNNRNQSCCGSNANSRENYSLGCDRRLLDIANPKDEEIVLDFGSGSGTDARRIADRVKLGHVYGIDFSQKMINFAEENSQNYDNVEFIQAHLTDVPLEENIGDLIVSNCVFNLIEDKESVFQEVYRLLRPGGRMVISDMITSDNVDDIDINDYCACIGGATSVEEYMSIMEEVGFINRRYIAEFDDVYTNGDKQIPYQSVIFVGYKP